MSDTALYVKQIEVGLMQNFVYIIGDPATHEAMIVDPAWEVDRLLRAVEQDDYRIARIALTHAHFDHINGVEEVLATYDVPIHAQRREVAYLPAAWRTRVTPMDAGATIPIGQREATVVHTPGHTPGSQCLLIDGQLITGDTLFVRTCGRTDLPGGDPKQMFATLTTTMQQLDAATVVLPGHNYGYQPTSTMDEERRENPFFQLTELDAFLRAVRPMDAETR